MRSVPDIRYAKTPDGTQLAYQVFGDGPRDLLLVWGGISHIEMLWDDPTLVRIFRRLGAFARVIQFDRRGTGMSDRGPSPATLEDRMEDVRAVLDAAGSQRAAIVGESEGGPMSCLFAATYPERTTALILYGPVIRMVGDKSFPWAPPREVFEAALKATVAEWGSEELIWGWAPSVGDDPRARQFFSRFMRLSSSPSAFHDQMSLNAEIDIRAVLPMIAAPTLVLHRRDDAAISVGQGRYAAQQIPGARYVEFEGEDHLLIGGDPDPLLDEIEEFITGIRGTRDVDRIVTTIVFTDIVDSTKLASELGDRRWRGVLDSHDAALRRLLPGYGGTEVNTTGDGMLASFDGPAHGVGWARAVMEATAALGIELRAGVHTGGCEVRGKDLAGLAIHIAARIGALAGPGEILASATVRDLASGSGIKFSARGTVVLKGLSDDYALFAATR